MNVDIILYIQDMALFAENHHVHLYVEARHFLLSIE